MNLYLLSGACEKKGIDRSCTDSQQLLDLECRSEITQLGEWEVLVKEIIHVLLGPLTSSYHYNKK